MRSLAQSAIALQASSGPLSQRSTLAIATTGGEAVELRVLCSQKEPGVGSTIQALEWPPALRLWPAGLAPDLALVGLHIRDL